jgi:hypothetical protein
MTATNTLAQARQDIRDRLAANFTQECEEGSVPDATSLRRINGAVYPYIVYRFPDVIPTAQTGMAGPWSDTLLQPVFFLPVGPDIDSTQALYMKIFEQFLGFTPTEASPMVKRAGGGTFPIGVENGATEAYISPINFSFSTTIRLLP